MVWYGMLWYGMVWYVCMYVCMYVCPEGAITANVVVTGEPEDIHNIYIYIYIERERER